MESLSLKYRPRTFEDVVEQGITTKILNKVIEKREFKNAYLLAGPSGCGKTTLARILANRINQVNDADTDPAYIEIDAASNNGVDQIRTILEEAKARDMYHEYKIFIIDECHMITTAGWNAFLKGIEEPAEFTIFIFCTTDPNKIPATILNRVQRYNLSRISLKGIYNRLIKICQAEGFTNYEATCDLISKMARGGMRDAITLLDQCADLSTDLSIDTAKELLGDFSYESMIKFTNSIIDGNKAEVLSYIDNLYNNGYDLKGFIDTYLECVIDFNKYILFRDINLTNFPEYLEHSTDQKTDLRYVTSIQNGASYFNWLATRVKLIKTDIKNDPIYKTTIETEFLKICVGK